MSKAVLISIRPEWARKILNGSKTVEIRKTAPKCGVPFKCLLAIRSARSTRVA